MKTVIAILCSDLHLRHTVPPARAAEPDWYAAMGRVLDQLRAAQAEHGGCPIIIAGDIFHKWNSPAELINWAIANMPSEVYAIPGQHDLPFHNLDDIKKSAYWTLVAAGAITDLDEMRRPTVGRMPYVELYPFPWGSAVGLGPTKRRDDTIRVAVVHAYIHKGGSSQHVGASPDDHIDAYAERLNGFDIALFGDNHYPFTEKTSTGCTVVNSGGMMLTSSDAKSGSPGFSLLFSDGSVERVAFDTSADLWSDESLVGTIADDAEIGHDLIESLTNLAAVSLDYRQSVRDFLKHCPQTAGVSELLLGAIE